MLEFYVKTVVVFTFIIWLEVMLFCEAYCENGWVMFEKVIEAKKHPLRLFSSAFPLAVIPILRDIYVILLIIPAIAKKW